MSMLKAVSIRSSLLLDCNVNREQNIHKQIPNERVRNQSLCLYYASSLPMTKTPLREKIKFTLDFAFAKISNNEPSELFTSLNR